MQKKTVATSLSTLLILLFITIIGACFSAFIVAKNKIELKNVTIIAGDGVVVEDKHKQVVKSLKIFSSEVGVRPATGEQDSSTNIPTTVNDSIGTEGAYAVFFLTTQSEFEIILKSVHVTNGFEDNKENLFVGILDGKSEAITFEKVGSVIFTGEKVERKEFIVVTWIDGDATKTIVGADIFIELEIRLK